MNVERRLGESEQEYKCRVVPERYLLVQGKTPDESDMVVFFKQAISADSRGAISSFHVRCERDGLPILGTGHLDTDTYITTIAKTLKQLTAWVHPDHFSTFTKRSKDHHDLLHSGFLAIALAVANMKTQLLSGGAVGGATAAMPLPKHQKEYVLRTYVASYVSMWDAVEQQASQFSPIFTKPTRVLPETPVIETRSKSCLRCKVTPPCTLVVSVAYPEAMSLNLPEYS